MNKLTPKQAEAYEAYEKFNNQKQAAESLGISRRSFRERFDGAKAKHHNTILGFKVTKINTDKYGTIRSMTQKLAPEIDHLKRTGKVIRRSTLYGADGSVTGEWIIRQPEDQVKDAYIDALHQSFASNVVPLGAPAVLSYDLTDQDLAMFISVDEHIGVKLCAEQVGENYGLVDAVELMERKFAQIVARTPASKDCVYLNLGDQFNANDHTDVTPGHKHQLNSDATFNTVSDAVVALNRRRINLLLSKFDNVHLHGTSGNHDIDPMGWLFRCYQIAYENEDRVSVDFASDGVGVFAFDNCMIGYHHGHKMKPEVMAGATADRYSEIYGRTKFRYLHTGHVHHDKAIDTWGGFKYESHRSMTPKDNFSYSNGYVSRQTMKAMVYNKDEGEVARFQTSLY
jgi:hypothetical protein